MHNAICMAGVTVNASVHPPQCPAAAATMFANTLALLLVITIHHAAGETCANQSPDADCEAWSQAGECDNN